jgi:uncharacterized protein
LNEDFFYSKVSISVVLSSPYDLMELKCFFDNDPLLEKLKYNTANVRETETTFFDSPEVLTLKKDFLSDSGYSAMLTEYKQNLKDGNPYKSRFLAAVFESRFVKLHKRQIYAAYPDYLYPNSICIPGLRRVFVASDGVIKICERVDSGLTIGDVFHDFDYDRIYKILETYIKNSSKSCVKCIANRHCYACFSNAFSSNGFIRKEKNKLCREIQNSFIDIISDYCEILEQNSNAFDFAN